MTDEILPPSPSEAEGEICELTPDDWPVLGRLMAESFTRGHMTPQEWPLGQGNVYPPARRIGLFERGTLVAAATIFDIEVTWDGGRTMRMGGVAGIGCAAAARGRGYVARLLAESLAGMREGGQPISGLYPFSHAYYRRHGWESVGEQRRFTIPTRSIPRFAESVNVRTWDGPEALETVMPIYDAFARRYRSMTTRKSESPKWWPGNLANTGNRRTYVQVYHHPVSGAAEGYFPFRFPESGGHATLGEFIALTPEAMRGLLGTLRKYDTQIDRVTWYGPVDHPLPQLVWEHELEIVVRPIFMGRVVDLTAAFEALTCAATDGEATIRVHDQQADWNDGAFDVRSTGGKVSVARSNRAPGCEMDIQTLSAAYWGSPSLTALRAAGRVAVGREADYEFLCAMLPAAKPYICDGF